MSKTRDEVRIEALGALRKHRRAGAGISMGVGKTRLGLEHFQLVINKVNKDGDHQAHGLVVAPTKVIIQAWKDEAKKWKMEHLLDKLEFSTYRSLDKQEHNYDVIYLDECHSLKYSHDDWLTKFDGYIIGLTGTPPDEKYKSEKVYMVKQYCPIVYTYLVDEAISDNILNDYNITVHMLELSKEKNHLVKNGDNSWYTSEFDNYQYWTQRVGQSMGKSRMTTSVMRMKAMQVYTTKDRYGKRLLDQSKEKCILFANEQKQADALCTHSFHSNNKDSELNMKKFEQGKINKLSCVLQLSEGANIKGLKRVILLHAYGNNKKSAQRIGRGLRLNPDDMCQVDILCFKNTVDERWVQGALEGFDQNKITWYDTTII